MRLDWAMLANSAQVSDGLAFVLGGGIDTINSPQIPAAFNGAVLVRLLLHRTEVDKAHVFEVRIMDEDGNQLGQMAGNFNIPFNKDIPVGWEHPVMFAVNIAGLQLAKEGRYSFEILADSAHLKSLNFRVKLIRQQ